jgi:predicted dehydrogenase
MVSRHRTRREFLKQGIALGALLSSTPPLVVRHLGAADATPPSDRLTIGVIGVGGRGGSLLHEALGNPNVQVRAVCDVDAQHLANAAAIAGAGVDAYADYRKIIERNDIDAVVVAAPDHWHALITIDACAAKKDVYCEKPLSTYIPEGRAMVAAARKYSRIVQVGTHHRSASYAREIAEIVRSGRIGKVRAVKTWMWANPVKEPTPPTAPPPNLDYDRWLGPARPVPYHADRVHFNFRWCRDYAGGYTTDWGVHMLSMINFALDVETKWPSTVVAQGTFAERNLWDFPLTMNAEWEFEDPKWTLTWTQPADGGDMATGQNHAMTYYGEAGELRTFFGGWEFFRDGKKADLPPAPQPVTIPQSPGQFQNWIDSVRSRRLPLSDVEIGHRMTSTCLLGNIALWAGRKLRWDGRAEKFIDDAEADKLLFTEYWPPYKLPA